MSSNQRFSQIRGPISWMVHNRVTPNLLMIFLLLGGLFMTTRIKQEVFPEFDLDMVTISVGYSGASPEEVEQGIILAVEEAIRAIDGVKELTATATEGNGTVNAELEEGVDQQTVYQEIKQEIDRITTFPEDADEPEVSLATHLREVLAIDLYGDVSEMALRETADQVRDRLLQASGITQVELAGARDYEILVEVPQDRLRAYGLTLEEIAAAIDSASTEIPGGSVDTAGGDILLRLRIFPDLSPHSLLRTAFSSVEVLTRPFNTISAYPELTSLIPFSHASSGLEAPITSPFSPSSSRISFVLSSSPTKTGIAIPSSNANFRALTPSLSSEPTSTTLLGPLALAKEISSEKLFTENPPCSTVSIGKYTL